MSVSVRTWVTSQGEVRTKWVVRYYDRNRKYRTKTFNRKRDADLWSAHTKIDLKKGVHRPDSTSVTLGFACEWWVDRARNEKLERSTIAKYALRRVKARKKNTIRLTSMSKKAALRKK